MAEGSRPNRKRTVPARFSAYEATEVVLNSDQLECENDSDLEIEWTDRSSDSSFDDSDRSSESEPEEEVETADLSGRGTAADGDAGPSTSTSRRSRPVNSVENVWIHRPTDPAAPTGSTTSEFEFEPTGDIGVKEGLFGKLPTELECFFALFTANIVAKFITQINSYAQHKVNINTPATKRSRFGSWENIRESEVYKLIAVLMTMGMDSRPSIRDYWTEFLPFNTPWYNTMFSRERFEVCMIIK